MRSEKNPTRNFEYPIIDEDKDVNGQIEAHIKETLNDTLSPKQRRKPVWRIILIILLIIAWIAKRLFL